MAIRIITDSAADYSAQEIEKRQITCIPMTVTFGDTEYLDGRDITKEQFFELLTTESDFPHTSQPSPADFLECFNDAKSWRYCNSYPDLQRFKRHTSKCSSGEKYVRI